jgi:hypothetical protein
MLVVEDGTGLADAESYLSVADFRAYCAARGMAVTTATDEVVEQRLRQATDYIDTFAHYKGKRETTTQALEFPRSNLRDWSGILITGKPRRVVFACAELAQRALTGTSLLPDLDRGGKITSEAVGPISVSYAPDAPAGMQFTAVLRLLDPYILDRKVMLPPAYDAPPPSSRMPPPMPAPAYFRTGMDDQPPGTMLTD